MKLNQITASSLGNILEWLDFGLFIFLAPIIGTEFFPIHNSTMAEIAAFGVFAAGFICRPLGGLLFGHFGDRIGRAKPLRLSILIITTTTFLVGVLPTYATVGMLSPILFTLLRLMQGIAIGGEYSGVMTYLAESAPVKSRGFITSFAATGANLGFFLATVMVLALQNYFSPELVKEWGWRIPFIAIGALGACISYYRLKLLETPAYQHLKQTKQIEKSPLLKAFRAAPKSLLTIFALNCMSCTFYYVFFGYMPDYLQRYAGMDAHHAFAMESYALVGMLILVPFMGILGDRIGRKKMLMMTTTAMVVLALPFFYLLQSGVFNTVVMVLGMATLLSSMDQGNTLTTVVENCPLNVRYSGVAFSYNLSAAIFGGLSPLIVIALIKMFDAVAPGYYIMLTSGIGLLAVLSLSNHFQEGLLATTTPSSF
jgi:MHS family proline/betaine transporter-like MFS transporter